MTDVPFVALGLVAMALLVVGLRKDSRFHVACGVLVALLAILVRQLGIALLLGYAVASVVKDGWQLGRGARGVALVALGLAVHFGYQFWLLNTGRVPIATGHADVQTLVATLEMMPRLKAFGGALVYTGFFVAPLVVGRWFLGSARARPQLHVAVDLARLLGGCALVVRAPSSHQRAAARRRERVDALRHRPAPAVRHRGAVERSSAASAGRESALGARFTAVDRCNADSGQAIGDGRFAALDAPSWKTDGRRQLGVRVLRGGRRVLFVDPRSRRRQSRRSSIATTCR